MKTHNLPKALVAAVATALTLTGVLTNSASAASHTPSPHGAAKSTSTYTFDYVEDPDDDVTQTIHGSPFHQESVHKAVADTEILDFTILHYAKATNIQITFDMQTVPLQSEKDTTSLFRVTGMMGANKIDIRSGRTAGAVTTQLQINGAVSNCDGDSSFYSPKMHTVTIYTPISCLPRGNKITKVYPTVQGYYMSSGEAHAVAIDSTSNASLTIK